MLMYTICACICVSSQICFTVLVPERIQITNNHLTGKFAKFLSVVVVTPAGIGQLGSVESPQLVL